MPSRLLELWLVALAAAARAIDTAQSASVLPSPECARLRARLAAQRTEVLGGSPRASR